MGRRGEDRGREPGEDYWLLRGRKGNRKKGAFKGEELPTA